MTNAYPLHNEPLICKIQPNMKFSFFMTCLQDLLQLWLIQKSQEAAPIIHFEILNIDPSDTEQNYGSLLKSSKKRTSAVENSWSAMSLSTGKLMKWATREFSMCSCKERTIGNTFTYLFFKTIPESSNYSIHIFPSMDTKHKGKKTKQKEKPVLITMLLKQSFHYRVRSVS